MRNVTGAVWTSIRVSFPGPQEGSGAAEALKRSGETAGCSLQPSAESSRQGGAAALAKYILKCALVLANFLQEHDVK